MKLLSVTTKNEAGEHRLDPNKIVELLIRIVAVVGAIIAWQASQQSGQNTQRLEKQKHFLQYQFNAPGTANSNYVETVEQTKRK